MNARRDWPLLTENKKASLYILKGVILDRDTYRSWKCTIGSTSDIWAENARLGSGSSGADFERYRKTSRTFSRFVYVRSITLAR